MRTNRLTLEELKKEWANELEYYSNMERVAKEGLENMKSKIHKYLESSDYKGIALEGEAYKFSYSIFPTYNKDCDIDSMLRDIPELKVLLEGYKKYDLIKFAKEYKEYAGLVDNYSTKVVSGSQGRLTKKIKKEEI